jgi:dihydroorotate dehydrogenase
MAREDSEPSRLSHAATGLTGFVYGDPLRPHRIHGGLARYAWEAGLSSIQQAIGTSQPATGTSP